MNVPRPIEHQVFPDALQAHSLMPTGIDLKNPDQFDSFLREEALISRGLVVVDSDLNNNEIFHRAADYDEGLFWPAIRSGFIRRATRTDGAENRFTQRKIAEGLKKSAPQRFERLPAGYLAKLDAALASAEAATEPLLWTPEAVYETFTGRLLDTLAITAADETRGSAQRDLIVAVRDWVVDELDKGNRVGSAEIESRFQPPSDNAEFSNWNAVWQLVLAAQTGNIPKVFGGLLKVKGVAAASDRLMPAGPEASAEEQAVQAKIYARDYTDIDFEVRRIVSPLPAVRLNKARLNQLSLEQVEELREAADPGEFFSNHFAALGSAQALAATAEGLREAGAGYLDRLASAGDMLTRQKIQAEFEEATELIARVGPLNRIVEHAMAHYERWVLGAPQLVVSDFTSLFSVLDLEIARDFAQGEVEFTFVYKRPEYRVAQRLDES
jgi:hypothetical protein